MRKVLAGVFGALVVIGAGAYAGVLYWAQYAATREVDAALDRWRAGGGTATRGHVAFDLWTRTVKIADVALRSRASPDDQLSIAQVVATGVDASGGADRLELVDLEIRSTMPGITQAWVEQKAPRVAFTGFSARPSAPRPGAGPFDWIRIWLEQFSTITAQTIEVPSLAVTVALAAGDDRPDRVGAVEYTSTNLVLRDVANGHVAEATIDGIAVRSNAGRYGEFTGEIGKTSILDMDVAPVLAFLDPSRPGRDGYQRVYRQVSTGPYTLRFADGGGLTAERFVAEDIGLYPSKLSLDDFIFLAEIGHPAGKPPTPTQVSMLAEKVAGLYDGIHLGELQLLDLRLSALRVARLAINGLDDGRLAELSIEGVDGGQFPASAPPRIGGLTAKGFQIGKLLRSTSRLVTSPEWAQGPAQVLQDLSLLDGVEVKEIALADPATQRVVHLEALNASWGQFVGDLPSEVRLSARVRAPVSAMETEPILKALAAHGIPAMTASLDLGASWTEAAQTVAVAPATFEIGDLFAVSLKASVGKVPREAFSSDPVKALASVGLAEAGPIELTLRDLGALDLVAAELARAKAVGPEAGRSLLAESFAQKAAAFGEPTPQAQAFFDAVGQFLRTKGETLTITLTPRGRIGVLEVIDGARQDPVAALLANFGVEARTGK
ncbi:MAG: hypothetical protein J2P50_16995 [Hyphomicrobiaceae bacterium]|nr:hypothetical protein [Hyphomicrobiaceae bacterium]